MYEILSYPPGMSSALGELVESLAHELDQRVYVHEAVDQREWGYPHHLLPSHIHLKGGEEEERFNELGWKEGIR